MSCMQTVRAVCCVSCVDTISPAVLVSLARSLARSLCVEISVCSYARTFRGRVDKFGIDSNIFASDYKAPTNHDHIGVAMIHVDDKADDESKPKKAKEDPSNPLTAMVNLGLEAESTLNGMSSDSSKIPLPDNETV